MIDLLREQLYQQQLCISRNVSYDEDDLDLHLQSSGSSIQSGSTALSEPALAELSQQITDIRDSVLRTQLQQQVDLNKSFSDVSFDCFTAMTCNIWDWFTAIGYII